MNDILSKTWINSKEFTLDSKQKIKTSWDNKPNWLLWGNGGCKSTEEMIKSYSCTAYDYKDSYGNVVENLYFSSMWNEYVIRADTAPSFWLNLLSEVNTSKIEQYFF